MSEQTQTPMTREKASAIANEIYGRAFFGTLQSQGINVNTSDPAECTRFAKIAAELRRREAELAVKQAAVKGDFLSEVERALGLTPPQDAAVDAYLMKTAAEMAALPEVMAAVVMSHTPAEAAA